MKSCNTLKMSKIFNHKILFLSFINCLVLSGCASIKHFISPDAQYNTQETAPIKRVDSTQNQYYIVQPNESLYQVAKKFNVTERALILWNNLKSPYTLKQGQVLQVFPNESKTKQPEITKFGVEEVRNDDIYSLDDSTLSYDVINEKQNHISPSKTIDNKPTFIEKTEIVSEEIIVLEKSVTPQRESAKGYYVVKSGDSLLGIANSFDLTLSQIAQMNNINPPYPVYIGQKISVNPDLITTENKPVTDLSSIALPKDKQVEKPIPEIEELKSSTSEPDQLTAKITSNSTGWKWPISSKTIVSENDTIALLQGSYHQPVVAACSGKVIYAGIGVEGYGKMIIITCKNNYMTAYSNLNATSVKEGQSIKEGSKIGELGKFKGESVLGFEIRKDGVPVKIQSLMP